MIKRKKKIDVNGYELDKEQVKAVTSKRKNILVLAGAGAGKTLTIVARIKYLLKELNVNPRDIICISFTNNAVLELKKKLNEKIDVMTFHKLALKIIGNKKELLVEDMLTDVIMKTFSNDNLYGLYEMGKEDMNNLVKTFINLFKANSFKVDDFLKFINNANNKEKVLLKEIMKCYICYESYLNREKLMDFNDVINMAIDALEKSKVRYKYIIIDEYQDTSYTKFNLIKKLIDLSCGKLFAVGDDFQSIYRFSGSSVEIITNFRKYFPAAKIIKLKNTYRCPNELIKIAGKFIMKNPFQLRKKLRSKSGLKQTVIIVYYNDLNYMVNKIIKEDEINGNIFVLARNNNDLNSLKIDISNYQKMSVHKSKGLESDYVFLINVSNSLNGFPNRYENHPILRFVNNYKEYYPYEEERRLFYVALTRSKKRMYLFVPKNNESIFIKELKKYKNVIIREK